MTRLFGTDGMRGVALEPPLDRDTLSRLGHSLAAHLGEAGRPVRVLMAGDSRASTEVLAGWVGGAFRAAGGEVVWAGVLPTPAVSHLLRDSGAFGGGVIVSASHNPADDNGIKLVTGGGVKWPVEEEIALEGRLGSWSGETETAELPGTEASLTARYLELLADTLPPRPLAGLRLVVDAANGAAVPVAHAFFSSLGADVRVINAAPDGRNINRECGALHPEGLAGEVVRAGADAGVALDGDADRAVLVCADGRILDGDDVLDIWAQELDARGALPGRAVVATVMSNLGLEMAFRDASISLVRCPVGDREVWDAMQRDGIVLGGEQSGHVICSHHAVTGDGMLTAAQVLAIARRRGVGLCELATLVHFPQVLLNVRVGRRVPLDEVAALGDAIRAAERALGGQGRVLVRYSGTEPLLRVMVEAPTNAQAWEVAEHIAATAREALGAVTAPVPAA